MAGVDFVYEKILLAGSQINQLNTVTNTSIMIALMYDQDRAGRIALATYLWVGPIELSASDSKSTLA